MNKAELFNCVEEITKEYDWSDGIIPEQVRALFTTWCFVNKIEADTSSCDTTLAKIYEIARVEGIWNYDDFENFMLELII